MDNYLLKYIAQRMCEMGFTDYRFEAVRIASEGSNVQVKAYNEFYYLVSKTVPVTLVIASDTNIFNEATAYNSYNFYQIQEFTGLIEISQGVAEIDLEFIKVIPVCPCKQLKS